MHANNLSGFRTTPSRRRRAVRAGLALLALCTLPDAGATVLCVPADATLAGAIQQANEGPDGSTWEIRVHTGTYNVSAGLSFDPASGKENKTFKMTGGWTGASGTCQNRTIDPSSTIVQGVASTANTYGSTIIFDGNNASYDIESIRFQNFYQFVINDGGCGIDQICPGTSFMRLEHNEFDNGETFRFNAEDASQVVFRDNLVTHMQRIHGGPDPIDSAPVGILIDTGGSAVFAFNTFASLTCGAPLGGVYIENHISDFALHHNIFQTTGCANDVYVDPAGDHGITPVSNLYSGMGGLIDGNLLQNGNVQNFNPQFTDINIPGNYHLQLGSPAINAGLSPTDAVLLGLIAPPTDNDGNARLIGSRYDIGAYESAVNDFAPPVITVNSSNDVDDGTCNPAHCSLREAINQANQQAGTAQRITFAISGSCPQVILLNSELPDVTDALAIDGYSQPGAIANDLDVGTDAEICIVLAPGASGISHALAVPAGALDSTHLSVSGIGFGSNFYTFTSDAIDLRAGSGHFISGNVFGGLGPGALGSLGTSLTRAVYITGTAQNVTVGGDDNAMRNTMGYMQQNAVVITGAGTGGHTISNNYIGLTPNGIGAQPNAADGISATGGKDVTIKNNAIAASDRGITLSGSGTTGFSVTGNRIGTNAYGVGLAQHANNVGIQIQGASDGHTIGAPPVENLPAGAFSPGGFANDIRNNLGPGIYLSGTGAFITMRGNRIEQNGDAGVGLGLDLGAVGQLANDAGDGDAGTNNLQNYPVVKGVARTGVAPGGIIATVKSVLNTKPNEALRIDVYRSPTCPKEPTGANATTYLRGVDVNSGATGIVSFTASVLIPGGTPGYLTATATTSTGNTSELAPCTSEDTIFVDGHELPGL